MLRNLDDLDIGAAFTGARESQAGFRERMLELAIELVAMTVALTDFVSAVRLCCEGTGLQHALPGTQAHRAAHLLDTG